MTNTRSAEDQRQLRVFRILVTAALVAALIAAAAGVLLLILDPDEGSSAEAALGIAAASAGLLTGVLAGIAAVYAQIKNLWRFVPPWGRIAAWIAIAVALLYALLQAG